MDSFHDSVTVITGAASGIGRATAHSPTRRGTRVVIADIDGVGAHTVATEITDAAGQPAAVRCDVGKKSAFEELEAFTLHTHGVGVTVLCLGPVKTNIMTTRPRTFGSDVQTRSPGPQFGLLEPDVLGEQVTEAILTDTFHAPHPPPGPRRPGRARLRLGRLHLPPNRADPNTLTADRAPRVRRTRQRRPSSVDGTAPPSTEMRHVGQTTGNFRERRSVR